MKLLGPVLWYDLIRMVRRTRSFVLRCLYPLLLLGILFLMYENQLMRGQVPPARLAQFAESFFTVFMIVQFALILFLTPAYTAGTIADEKQRGTLEFLMATDLRNQEIVLGKLLSRLGNLGLFLLAGLPVLSLIQLFGGVDPGLLWSGFAATALTMASLASLGVLLSVYARRPRDALAQAYVLVLIYFGFWGVLEVVRAYLRFQMSAAVAAGFVDQFLGVYNAGNIFAGLIELGKQSRQTGGYGDRLLELLRNYAIFHGIVTTLFTTLAVVRLRPIFLRQTYGQVKRLPRKRRARRRPEIGDNPMIWKEVHYELTSRASVLQAVVLTLFCILCLFPGFLIITNFLLFDGAARRGGPMHALGESMNIYVRIVGTIVASLALLRIAMHAAGTIGAERDRKTLDSLLGSPLTDGEIVFGKWVGSMVSATPILGLLGVIWLMGLLTGGLHLAALPVLLAELAVYSTFMASLGMAFATRAKTTSGAVMAAIATALFSGGGHWFCCLFCVFRLASGPWADWPFKIQAVMTPPFVMAFSAFWWGDFEHSWYRRELEEGFGLGVFGLAVFAALAGVLYAAALGNFKQRSGRITGRSLLNQLTRPRG